MTPDIVHLHFIHNIWQAEISARIKRLLIPGLRVGPLQPLGLCVCSSYSPVDVMTVNTSRYERLKSTRSQSRGWTSWIQPRPTFYRITSVFIVLKVRGLVFSKTDPMNQTGSDRWDRLSPGCCSRVSQDICIKMNLPQLSPSVRLTSFWVSEQWRTKSECAIRFSHTSICIRKPLDQKWIFLSSCSQ